RMPIPDFSNNKLGGPGRIVQIDETMLNFKCKSHRGRSPNNRTDALCVVEVSSGIQRVFATIIPDKKAQTLVPIICSQVASNSIIWTDEHRSYSSLSCYDFTHNTVCHKYEFVNKFTFVNTQAVESFNNLIKCEIKMRKGLITSKRSELLKEICWLYNNSKNLYEAVLCLIKYNYNG
ncbi:MAG: transposase, partial [Aeromonas sp.]